MKSAFFVSILSLSVILSCAYSADPISGFKKLNQCENASSKSTNGEIAKIYFTDHGIYNNQNTRSKIKLFRLNFYYKSHLSKIMKNRPEIGDAYIVHIKGYYIEKKSCPNLNENILLVTSIEEVR